MRRSGEAERPPRFVFVVALRGARLGGFGAYETERRPRGASRMNPLLHLLQSAVPGRPWLFALGAWLKTGGAALAPAELSRRANKADNYGLSGHGTLQQM